MMGQIRVYSTRMLLPVFFVLTLIALVGSSGKLELAIVGDSAAEMLGIAVGTPVTITW